MSANQNPLKLLGIYHETYRRGPDGWRMASLTLQFPWTEGTGKVTPENPLVLPRRTDEQRKAAAAKLEAESSKSKG